jgi:sugar phosphate isomerase/epimerase
MSDWPVGLSTGCFYQTSILDCLETIHNSGFSMIEVCSFPAHLDYHDSAKVREAARRMDELGMEPYSFHAPFADHIDITALDQDCRNRAVQEILRAAEAAATLEVRHFVIHPGPEKTCCPPVEERFQRLENAARGLNQVARRCRELGVGFVLENMLPHLLFGQASDILWIMGAMDTAAVSTCLDTGHAYLSGDIKNVLSKLSGHLRMIHANDNHGNKDDHLPPGRGSIDWEWLLKELFKTNFRGGIILELAGTQDATTVLEAARRARHFLRRISRRLDVSPAQPSGVA